MPNYNYTFTHVDGRTFSTENGAYPAMCKVLGRVEADRLLDTQLRTERADLTKTNKAEFRVKGELVGTFSKRPA
jgi:hypothetical protein